MKTANTRRFRAFGSSRRDNDAHCRTSENIWAGDMTVGRWQTAPDWPDTPSRTSWIHALGRADQAAPNAGVNTRTASDNLAEFADSPVAAPNTWAAACRHRRRHG